MITAFLAYCLLQTNTPSSGNLGTFALIAAGVAWSALWINLTVIPFYNKGESLHKDYWANGRINASLAAIEADKLIPALARMFQRALAAQADKRKRPEGEIEALLQSVEFLPDLTAAQEAVGAMDQIRANYRRLKLATGRLWKWGLAHSLTSPLIVFCYVFLLPSDEIVYWIIAVLALLWLATLLISLVGMIRFHSQISQFSSSLEIDGTT